MIEDNIGATLFDRRRKPVTLMPGVQILEPELRDLSARLHNLRDTMKSASNHAEKSLAFVCQHALSATVSPNVVNSLTPGTETSVRLRSGNQDECLMHLISKDVDFAIMYALPGEDTPETSRAFEAISLGADVLLPVSTPISQAKSAGRNAPLITYPPEVFLGQVYSKKIRPRLPKGMPITTIAETALTLAMLQLVLTDIGIAWLPQSLIAGHLAEGRLQRMDDRLPAQTLDIRMVRLSGRRTKHADQAWRHLAKSLQIPMAN